MQALVAICEMPKNKLYCPKKLHISLLEMMSDPDFLEELGDYVDGMKTIWI